MGESDDIEDGSENLSRRSGHTQIIREVVKEHRSPPEPLANRMLWGVALGSIAIAFGLVGWMVTRELDRNEKADDANAQADARESGRIDALIEMVAKHSQQIETVEREVERLRR